MATPRRTYPGSLSLSLRARLLLLVFAGVVPAFVLIAHSAWESRAEAIAAAERQTRQLAVVVAAEQGRLIVEARQMLTILGQLPIVRDPQLLPRCHETLAKLRQQNPLYANIGMVDAQGNLLCSALPFQGSINFADREWFKRATASREFAVGDYRIALLAKAPVINVALPLFDESGRIEKIVYAPLALSWFERLAASLPLPEGTVLAVVDSQGRVLARHPDPNHDWQGKPAPETELVASLLAADCRGFAELRGSDGILRLNAIEPLQRVAGGCVHVRVGVPSETIRGPIERRFAANLAAMLAATLLVFAIAWIAGDRMVLRRMRSLAAAAKRLGAGDLAARTGLPHTREELGQLAASFDEMAAALQARDARSREADEIEDLYNRAPCGYHSLDAEGGIVRINDTELAWLGYRREELVGKRNFADLMTPESRTRFAENFPRFKAAGEVHDLELEILRRDGTILPVLVSATAIYDSDGRYQSSRSTIYDISDRRRAEDALRLAKDAAEEATRVKSEFLANMSHELRTPLNAIIGFSEVLKDGLMGELSPAQQEYVTDIFDSGQHLLSLINDILDLSKIEAGRMGLELEPVAPVELLRGSLAIVREKAAAHHVHLELEAAPDPGYLLLDARKTKQIVYNLLANAVKFTPEGGRVGLGMRRAEPAAVENWTSAAPTHSRLPLPEGAAGPFLEIAVDDAGIGIAPEDAARLFRPFSQIDASLDRAHEGTGLGLVLVARLAQLHGGTVAVASTPGHGSRFIVWLPWREADAAADRLAAPPPPLPAPASREALVVEDNPQAADLLRLQLEAEGFAVTRAASAEAALALADRLAPALIVLDILLPGMDGWDFLARIKQPEAPWAGVPVVIVSIVADARRGFSLGAADVLQKPVSRDEFAAALARLHFGHGDGQSHRVLVVDDDPQAVELLAAYLAAEGCQVLRAGGGREGIEVTRRELPDLIVLDLMMPEVSGFDVVEALHADARTAGIPIVVVTARLLSREDRERLSGCVAAILEKASFDRSRFGSEIRRAFAARKESSP